MREILEFRLLGIAAFAALIGVAIVVAPEPKFDPGMFVPVTLNSGQSMEIGQFEVTSAQWQACFTDHGCTAPPKSAATDMPMIGVNSFDVAEYLDWLNTQSTTHYRLPTADEWSEISGGLSRRETEKLFDDPRLAWAADYGAMEKIPAKLRPSGSFGTNENGLSDLRGNVWEWTSTCVAANQTLCPAYIAGGLHEAIISSFVRNPSTGGCAAGTPPANVGFRLVREN